MANRLISEKSPYLLQHAHNPVDWYPWGEEALQKAREEGKPIFLSVGYATCHWCHVMAHESFENNEVAALLNRCFVSIKVDGAIPAGNSVVASVLLFLGRRTGKPDLEERGKRAVVAGLSVAKDHPESCTHLLSALDFLSDHEN